MLSLGGQFDDLVNVPLLTVVPDFDRTKLIQTALTWGRQRSIKCNTNIITLHFVLAVSFVFDVYVTMLNDTSTFKILFIWLIL